MRKLALDEDILLKVEKPARYIGGEIGSVMKDPAKVRTRFAMCFPDVYEIGMSHLGIQILYAMLNAREDIWCERVYSPWTDLDAVMRERHIPLFALESQDPVRNFDFLGITIQYEMCYTNILQVLDLSGIPLHAKERTEDDPIVIGGGPCTYNPEPLAPFFDLFYIGEGETQMLPLVDLYQKCRDEGCGRREFLRRAARIPGIYVPSLYETEYREDGTIAAFRPSAPGVPERVRKEIVKDLSHTWYPEKPIVPFIRVTQDRVVLEIQRGCIRGCRFCQAGMIYRPVRERSLAFNDCMARKMLDATGQEEISLSSLSSSDYSGLGPLLGNLIDECDRRHVNISLPSLRIDSFSLDVMSRVQDVRKSSLTFAPEAGTQRMRDVINKGLTEEDILRGAGEAFRGGWSRVKLYFMLGLPGETEEDMRGIAELSEKVCEKYYEEVPREKRRGRIQLTASSSFFVPKPFTPFQWARMLPEQEYLRRARLVKDTFRAQKCGRSMHYQYHEADVTVLEGVLARGDRRVAPVIESAYRGGCLFDSWSDCFDRGKWLSAFEETGVDPDFYTMRERGEDEVFPWDFIDIGVTKSFLRREWNRAMRGEVTPNCREACSGCGASSFGCGICRTHGNHANGSAGAAEDSTFVTEGSAGAAEGSTFDTEGSAGAAEDSTDSVNAPENSSSARGNAKKETSRERRAESGMRIRVKFAKDGSMRYIGHLDILRYFQKAFQRAGLPLRFTEGFHPHPVLSFASPLGVGLTSEGEYFDTELTEEVDGAEILGRLNAEMSEGMRVLSVSRLPDTEKRRNNNAMALVGQAEYRVTVREEFPGSAHPGDSVRAFLAQDRIPVLRRTKKKTEEMDIRPLIYEMRAEPENGTYYLKLSAGSAANLRPETVMEALRHFLENRMEKTEKTIRNTGNSPEQKTADNDRDAVTAGLEQAGSSIERAGRYEIRRLDLLTAEGVPLGALGRKII